MILKQFKAGPFEANNYLIIDENTKKAALIDASGDFENIKSVLDENNATLEKILLTHGHFDHIGGCYDFQINLGTKVFIHKDDLVLNDRHSRKFLSHLQCGQILREQSTQHAQEQK